MDDVVISGNLIMSAVLFGAGWLLLKFWESYKAERGKALAGEYSVPISLPGLPQLTAKVFYMEYRHEVEVLSLEGGGRAYDWAALSEAERETAWAQVVRHIQKFDPTYMSG